MKKILILFIFINLCKSLDAQNISFNDGVTLLEFPNEYLGLLHPSLPCDYNEDGISDLTIALTKLRIYKGYDIENLESLDLPNIYVTNPLKTMDFDNDGDVDIITNSKIILNDQQDQFTIVNPIIEGEIIEAVDFNNDGLTDLFTHTNEDNIFSDQELIVYYNKGNNEFEDVVIHSGGVYSGTDVGDINNDGYLDIVAIDELEDFPVIIFNNEISSFSFQRTKHLLSTSHTSLSLVDLDSDGDLDIATNGVYSDLKCIENNEFLYQDNAIISISTPQIIYFNHNDFNADGITDFVFFAGTSSKVNIYVLEGKGKFEFYNYGEIASFEKPAGFSYPNVNYIVNNLSIFDYDFDGKKDVIYTDGFSDTNQIVWYKNTTVPSNVYNVKLNENTIILSPNPTLDNVRITIDGNLSENITYEIMTSNGKILKSGQVKNGFIDFTSLESGLYFVRFNEIGILKKVCKL